MINQLNSTIDEKQNQIQELELTIHQERQNKIHEIQDLIAMTKTAFEEKVDEFVKIKVTESTEELTKYLNSSNEEIELKSRLLDDIQKEHSETTKKLTEISEMVNLEVGKFDNQNEIDEDHDVFQRLVKNIQILISIVEQHRNAG